MIFNNQQITESEFSNFLDEQLQVRSSLKSIDTQHFSNLELKTFLKYCYVTFSPNETGNKVVKYLANRFKFHEISANLCRGDFFLTYKRPHGIKYIETKSSFLNKVGMFGVRNIRPWHDIDFYLLCFVPTPELDPLFYLVKLEDLMKRFTTTYMNGTTEENKENKKSGVGMTIANTQENLQYLSSISELNGNSLEDFIDYLEEFTYLPYGFNELKNDSPKNDIIENTVELPQTEIQFPKSKINYSNLGGFRVGTKYYIIDTFSKNYVDFISRVLKSKYFYYYQMEIREILGKNLVSNLEDFPSSTLKRPHTMHKVTPTEYLTTNNSSFQKKDIILKISRLLGLSCEFYSKDIHQGKMTVMAA